MSEHISTLQMRHFSTRTLPANEMTVLAEHLTDCRECRARLQEDYQHHRAATPFALSLDPGAWLKHEHLAYEQLVSYIDSGLDTEEREITDLHLTLCRNCREDVQSLREFRRQIAPEIEVSYAPIEQTNWRNRIRPTLNWLGWQWKPAYAAAMIVVLVLIAFVVMIGLKDKRVDEQQAQVFAPKNESNGANPLNDSPTTSQTDVGRNEAADNNTSEIDKGSEKNITATKDSAVKALTPKQSKQRVRTNPSNSSAAATIALNDGQEKISLDEAGNLRGLDNLSTANTQVVRETLLAQNLTRLADLTEIISERGTLRGNASEGQSFRLLSPAQSVTAKDRPTFKWEAIQGATSYRVYVGDANNLEVAGSEELPSSVNEWTPPTSLARGRVYIWAVIAKVNGNEIIAPAASQPEMKFKILSEDNLREMTELQNSTRSHLALGIFYAKVGMLEEAEREFQALVRQNPQSPVALKLLRSVQSWR